MKPAPATHLPQKLTSVPVQPSFFQRIATWRNQTPVQEATNASKFDELELDQRVRLSGEW